MKYLLILFVVVATVFTYIFCINTSIKKYNLHDDNLYLPYIPKKYVWTTMASTDTHINQVLGMYRSLRDVQTSAELVLFLFNCNVDHINEKYTQIFEFLDIRIIHTEIPIRKSDSLVYNKLMSKLNKWWDWIKLESFKLVEYDKVIFLDSDLFFLENVDELFDEADGTHSNGPVSPFNSGLVVLKPSIKTYNELLSIIKEGNFTYETGWRNAFSGNFHASETTQGLYYYYYHFLIHQFKMLDRDVYNYQGAEPSPESVKVVHFTRCVKVFNKGTRCPKFKAAYMRLHEQNKLLFNI